MQYIEPDKFYNYIKDFLSCKLQPTMIAELLAAGSIKKPYKEAELCIPRTPENYILKLFFEYVIDSVRFREYHVPHPDKLVLNFLLNKKRVNDEFITVDNNLLPFLFDYYVNNMIVPAGIIAVLFRVTSRPTLADIARGATPILSYHFNSFTLTNCLISNYVYSITNKHSFPDAGIPLDLDTIHFIMKIIRDPFKFVKFENSNSSLNPNSNSSTSLHNFENSTASSTNDPYINSLNATAVKSNKMDVYYIRGRKPDTILEKQPYSEHEKIYVDTFRPV